MKFLDPTNDYAFKQIFENEAKKDILINFLNSILQYEGEETITDVTLLNPRQAPHIAGAKETILDVRCHDQSGAEYIVEMQVVNQKAFDKRVLYYASKAYSQQLSSSKQYDQLNPIIFLGILNFSFTENAHYLSTHQIYDIETKEHLLKDFQFTFVELPKFLKQEKDLQTVADKWIYFLKHAQELEAVPAVIHEQALKEAFEIVNRINWNQTELDYYDQRAIAVVDEAMRVQFGIEWGRKEGKEEGLKEEKKRIALKMLAGGTEVDSVSEITGLTTDELEQLQHLIGRK